MQEELEYKKEKGLLYRRTSPDNPLQMAAGRRLNKSVDQSSRQKYLDVDYVKNIFDKSEPSSYKYQNNELFNGVSGGTNAKSKGMFLSRKQDKRQGEQGEGTKARDGVKVDAQFLKNADLFF